jgi:TolB-like protein/DNA-binding winged helix-turn-helix (wHTH) protein/Tfp pilus assembly protein PilF
VSDEKPPVRFRFGVYELDTERGELCRSGVLVRLQAKPLRLLGLLVARANETVSREEIRQHVWPSDVHVEFDQGINACIKQIRAALKDSADVPRVVQTVQRGGYRFLLPVEPLAAPGRSPLPPKPRGRRAAWAAAAVVALILLGALVRSGVAGRMSHRSQPVLAVLPFSVFNSEKEDAFFRDSLADEVITQLGRRYGARIAVIARTSVMKYDGTTKGIGTIGRELGADFVLEGSVRRVGDRIRVNAQLIRAADESHVWASAFQRESGDLLKLQVELGETIADGLALKLAPNAGRMAGATTPAAYEGYLRARHMLGQGHPRKARQELERVVAADPGFAPAWVALAQAYSSLGSEAGMRQLAKDAVARALTLDDQLPEAHQLLAMIRFYQDYDAEGARQAFERAIEQNPGYATAHQNYAAYFSALGRHDEAIAEVQQARRLDPLSSMVNSDVGWYYYFARRYDEAVDHSKRTLALDPKFFWANLCIQFSYLQRPDWHGAIEYARKEMTDAGVPEDRLGGLLSPDRKTALGTYWRWRLEGLEAQKRSGPVDPSTLAQIHMALGEPDKALAELEDAFESRAGWILPFLNVDPVFDPLRADPKFRDLVARIASTAPSSADARKVTARAPAGSVDASKVHGQASLVLGWPLLRTPYVLEPQALRLRTRYQNPRLVAGTSGSGALVPGSAFATHVSDG